MANPRKRRGHEDVWSEAAEQRRNAYIDKVMRGEIRIPGVPVLPGYPRKAP